MPSDSSLRIKIADVIETATLNKAVVFSYWVLGQDQTRWPGLLRSPNDLNSDGTKRVHGYVITRRESTGTRVGNGCVQHTYSYLIQGFHYYYSGPESDNSEKLLTAEIDAITDKFDHRELLDADFGRVEPVQWTFDLKSVGGELLHIVAGNLILPPCKNC